MAKIVVGSPSLTQPSVNHGIFLNSPDGTVGQPEGSSKDPVLKMVLCLFSLAHRAESHPVSLMLLLSL
jgi:hypothetical protein